MGMAHTIQGASFSCAKLPVKQGLGLARGNFLWRGEIREKMIAVIAIIKAAWELLVWLNAGSGKMSPGGQKCYFQIFLKKGHFI